MKQGTNEIPGQNPGGSTPQSLFPLEESLISGEHFRAHARNFDGAEDDSLATKNYTSWIESLQSHLSPTAQQIIASWWSFKLLQEVYNCGAAHTKLFGPEVDHTRREHCIHAAYVANQVADRALINLTPHERTVLELVMLLHDPHRLGSHALDRVIASIPGANPISNWNWGHDFHEYHGAQEVYRDRPLRQKLDVYHADVLAVLSFPDTRDPQDPSRIEDFGPTPPVLPSGAPAPLPKDRIRLLYQLKDEIDRMSYLELDLRRSGLDLQLVQAGLACIQHYQEHMVTFGSNLAIVLPTKTKDAQGNSEYPFDPMIGIRQLHREHIATLPSPSLVDAVLREALWQTLAKKFPGKLDSAGCYKYARNIALEGSYQKLFGTSALEILGAPRSSQAKLGLEDLYAPLVTLSRDDLYSSMPSGSQIFDNVPPEVSSALCGVPRTDMTVLEHNLKRYLRSKGLDDRIFVILSNDFEKIFEFKCVEPPAGGEKNEFLRKLTETSDNKLTTELLDVVRFAVRSSPQSEKLIVAMPGLDDFGNCRNLRPIQEAIRAFFRGSKILKDPAALEKKYNPRAFCDPLVPQIFRPEVQKRMKEFQPAWVTLGGCGLDMQ
jgi:hypothetical protein